MTKIAIIMLAMSLGIGGNIHGEYMEVKRNTKKAGCVLVSEDGNIWTTEKKVKGVKKGNVVLVYMSDNETPTYRYDDIIVSVEKR